MERLTRPNLSVDPDTDRFLHAKIGGKEIDLNLWKQSRDSTLNVLLNGPTSNGFCKDIFRKMARDLYERLKAYEDTGLEPEAVETVKLALAGKHMVDTETMNDTPISRLVELAEADKAGRCVVLPCRYDERWRDEDGRTVRITATTAVVDDFGTHINVYFTYEDATSCDDADSDCVTNWDYFSRYFTKSKAERAMEGKP